MDSQNMNEKDVRYLETLLARCSLNDQQAFAELYQCVSKKLNGIAYRIINNIESANEVLQEAFVQIWNNAGEFRPEQAEPMTWMASIVRYRAYDRLRLEKRRIEGAQFQTILDSLDEIETRASDGLKNAELDQQLSLCLSSLEVKQRKSVLLAYYYGFSREEIADKFETPINTVKSWLRRGIERLQLCLAN